MRAQLRAHARSKLGVTGAGVEPASPKQASRRSTQATAVRDLDLFEGSHALGGAALSRAGRSKQVPAYKAFVDLMRGQWKSRSYWKESGVRSEGVVVIKLDKQGRLVSEYTEKKTPQNPKPMRVTEYFWHDGKVFHRLAINHTLNERQVATAKGWDGNTLRFEGHVLKANAKPEKFAFNLVKNGSPRQLVFFAEFPGADGKLQSVGGGVQEKLKPVG